MEAIGDTDAMAGVDRRSSVDDILDADVDALINDYYVNYFPEDALVTNFDGWHGELVYPTDSGIYELDQDVVKIMEPMMINGAEITFYQDKNISLTRIRGKNNTFLTPLSP
jgi:hypothetical protein